MQQDFHDQSCIYGPIVQYEHGASCCIDGNLQKINDPCVRYHAIEMFHPVYQLEATLEYKKCLLINSLSSSTHPLMSKILRC